MPHKRIKTILLLSGAVIVISLSLLITFARPARDNQTQAPTEAPAYFPASHELPRNWKVYKDELYGFSVNYPETWHFRVYDKKNLNKPNLISSVEFSPVFFAVRVYKNLGGLPLEQWYASTLEGHEFSSGPWGQSEVDRKIRSVTIQGHEALEVSGFIAGNQVLRTFFTAPGEELVIGLELQISGPDLDREQVSIYESIRASFRLTR